MHREYLLSDQRLRSIHSQWSTHISEGTPTILSLLKHISAREDQLRAALAQSVAKEKTLVDICDVAGKITFELDQSEDREVGVESRLSAMLKLVEEVEHDPACDSLDYDEEGDDEPPCSCIVSRLIAAGKPK